MNKIIIILLIIVTGAVIPVLAQNKKISNPNLDKFVGTWSVSIHDTTLILTIHKIKVNTVKNEAVDMLEGNYILIKGGKVIAQPQKATLTTGSSFSEDGVNHSDEVNFTFNDMGKGKGVHVTFHMLSATNDKMRWSLQNIGAIRYRKTGSKSFDYTFSFPASLIFIKQ